MPTEIESVPKREARAEAFTELRQETHAQMEQETAERVKTNPEPTEDEINAGAFPELLEPQVRDAVFEMRKKGYATESPGFGGETGEVQSIDGYFEIDSKTEEVLRDIGVQVSRDEGFGPKYAFLRFSPDEPALEKIKAKWDEVTKLLPDQGQQAEPSVSGHAEEFIKQYAPERTDVLQRIAELREQHDKETEEAIAKKETAASERALGPFSPEEVKSAQSWASEYVVGYLKGERGLKGEYSDDEIKLLDNLGAKVLKAMRENPDTPINVDLSKDPQAYATWTKLINRMARRSIETKRQLQDQTKIDKIREELGLPKQAETPPAPEAIPIVEQVTAPEEEKVFEEQVRSFLDVIINDKNFRETINKYRNTKWASDTDEDYEKRRALNDLEVIGKMAGSMYDLIHKSGISYREITDGINVPNKEQFIRNFNSEISDRLVDAVSRTSKTRHITAQELIQGGQPDQAEGFVWFKGNAPRPPEAREVRFYINTSPDGTSRVAEHLAKLSDQLDPYGMRLQFKFRKDLGEYDRTDTCVAYLYMPKSQTPEQKAISDQWLERVKETVGQVPKDAIRNKNSFFTEKISEGVSFAEDTRESGSKTGESYTSQITKAVAESCGEVANRFDTITPEAVSEITSVIMKKLKTKNYF